MSKFFIFLHFVKYIPITLLKFLIRKNVTTVLFVPYASSSHQEYFLKVNGVFKKWGYTVESIHNKPDPVEAVNEAQSIFIGGGNTFLLLKTLYDKDLIPAIRRRVLEEGAPYLGSSAGTNVATCSINTTNDMPIVYPPSFDALALVPFNINPHYLDPEISSKHRGETREQRIAEFHQNNGCTPVLGLREGSSVLVEGNKATLIGLFNGRLFLPRMEPQELETESDLSFLL